MGTIKVKNLTTLKDFCALFRVALYLAGDVEQAQENGVRIHMARSKKTFTLTEEEEGI